MLKNGLYQIEQITTNPRAGTSTVLRVLAGLHRHLNEWEAWLLYVLKGVSSTALHTIDLVQKIQRLLIEIKREIRGKYKFYNQDLINNLFRHPYTKVAFLEKDLGVSRATATRYLDALADGGILQKHKLGRESFYTNHLLIGLLFNMQKMEV